MRDIKDWPTNPASTNSRVLELVTRAAEAGSVASLTFVVVNQGSCWPLFGRIDIARSSDLTRGPIYKYETVHVLSDLIPTEELRDRLQKAMSGGAFLCGGEEINHHVLNGQWSASRRQAFDYAPWPCVVLSVQASTRGSGQIPSPLVSAHAPLFANTYQLRKTLSGFHVQHADHDNRMDRVHLVVWDYRGRISSVAYESPTLSIRTEGKAIASMVLAGRIETASGEIVAQRPATPLMHVTSESEPAHLELALIDGFDLVDHVKEGPYSKAGRSRLSVTRPSPGGDATVIEQLLGEGENERIEYKPWIDLGAGGKRDELLETALAFANTKGGSIIVGVTRYGRPQGEDKHFKEWKGRYLERQGGDRAKQATVADQELIRIYGVELRDFLQTQASRRLDIQLVPSFIDGHGVLVCQIARGQEKPIATLRGNDIWIRVNATNRRPSPEELRELFGVIDETEE